MDLEIVILSEVSQTEKDKYHMLSLICGIEKQGTNKLIYKTEIELQNVENKLIAVVVFVQSPSCVSLFANPWTAALLTISQSLPNFMSIESVMPSNHFTLCCLLLLLSLFPSIRVFPESALRIRWPKLLELQLQHQSFQRIFRTDFP